MQVARPIPTQGDISSGISNSSVSLCCASLALRWLSALYIALCRLPALNIALIWLPTTRFFISRAPNIVTRLDVELQPLHRLPTLALSPIYSPVPAPCPQYSPNLAPNNSVLHIKGSKPANQTGCRIATPCTGSQPYI